MPAVPAPCGAIQYSSWAFALQHTQVRPWPPSTGLVCQGLSTCTPWQALQRAAQPRLACLLPSTLHAGCSAAGESGRGEEGASCRDAADCCAGLQCTPRGALLPGQGGVDGIYAPMAINWRAATQQECSSGFSARQPHLPTHHMLCRRGRSAGVLPHSRRGQPRPQPSFRH